MSKGGFLYPFGAMEVGQKTARPRSETPATKGVRRARFRSNKDRMNGLTEFGNGDSLPGKGDGVLNSSLIHDTVHMHNVSTS